MSWLSVLLNEASVGSTGTNSWVMGKMSKRPRWDTSLPPNEYLAGASPRWGANFPGCTESDKIMLHTKVGFWPRSNAGLGPYRSRPSLLVWLALSVSVDMARR